MIIVDTELSGLEPAKHSLVSIGAYDFSDPSRFFYEECRIWEGAHVMDEALLVNGFTREQISDPTKPSDLEITERFLKWALESKEHTIAGQNPATDRDFIKMTCERNHVSWPLAHRVIDLHSICYYHILKRGVIPPTENRRSDLNLDKILVYCGLEPEKRPHNGLVGAKLETECLSRLINEKAFFAEFSSRPIPWKTRRPDDLQ